MSAYSFTMHHLALCLPFILHASCMISYKDYLYKLLLVQVMAALTIPVHAEENLKDPINIRVDIIYPEPVTVVAFPAAAVEELTALRFRADITEAENASLRARIKTMEAIEKINRNRETGSYQDGAAVGCGSGIPASGSRGRQETQRARDQKDYDMLRVVTLKLLSKFKISTDILEEQKS
nr:hypothetical protein [Tanacetum cinerariifolium]